MEDLFTKYKGPYASLDDVHFLWRKPKDDKESSRVSSYLAVASNALRYEAIRVGKDLDRLVDADPNYLELVKSVVVEVATRAAMTSTDQEPMSQMSQSAGGYTVSGTFLVPGGGLFIKRSELARLGLRRQKVGVIDPYG